MLVIECTLISRAVRDFDIQIMKRALLVFGIASVTLCASFAQQSSGNSEGAAGTGSAGGSKAGPSRSSEQGTQTQRETQNQQGTSTQSGKSNQGARSSASAPSNFCSRTRREQPTSGSPTSWRISKHRGSDSKLTSRVVVVRHTTAAKFTTSAIAIQRVGEKPPSA